MGKMTLTAEPGKSTFTLTREFDAPRELVFEAYTNPALIPLYWGPRTTTTVVDKMDVKAGGMWRYLHRGEDGSEYGFRGVYHDVTAPERIINTYEFEPMAGHVGLVITTFEERDGKTLLTETDVFPSVEDRDGVLATGMEAGANELFDRFEELLAEQVNA